MIVLLGIAYFGIWVNVAEETQESVLGVVSTARDFVTESAEETGLSDQLDDALGNSRDELESEIEANDTLRGLRDSTEDLLEDQGGIEGLLDGLSDDTVDSALDDFQDGIETEAENLDVDVDGADTFTALESLPDDVQETLMQSLLDRLISEAEDQGIPAGHLTGVGAAEEQPASLPSDGSLPVYNRDDWRHWDNWERSCWTVREQVLLDESLIPVSGEDFNGRNTSDPDDICVITDGLWWDAFTGDAATAEQDSQYEDAIAGVIDDHFFTNPSDLDIDHLVALSAAHRSGGWQFNSERKRDFANWLENDWHLIGVAASTNRSKSDHVPTLAALETPGSPNGDGWVPENVAYHCTYAEDWVAVKTEWQLELSDAEAEAIDVMLSTC